MTTQEKNSIRSACPARFLVSSPHVNGSTYSRQVVYILEHNQSGAVGLLIDEKFQQAARGLREALFRAVRFRGSLSASEVAALPVTAVTWPAGQLDQELQYGVWMKGPVEFERVFGDYDDLWLELVRSVGRAVLRDSLNIRDLPTQPWLN